MHVTACTSRKDVCYKLECLKTETFQLCTRHKLSGLAPVRCLACTVVPVQSTAHCCQRVWHADNARKRLAVLPTKCRSRQTPNGSLTPRGYCHIWTPRGQVTRGKGVKKTLNISASPHKEWRWYRRLLRCRLLHKTEGKPFRRGSNLARARGIFRLCIGTSNVHSCPHQLAKTLEDNFRCVSGHFQLPDRGQNDTARRAAIADGFLGIVQHEHGSLQLRTLIHSVVAAILPGNCDAQACCRGMGGLNPLRSRSSI
jgi:hypothetical protein